MKSIRQAIFLFCLPGLVFISCATETQTQKIATLHEVSDPYYLMWATENFLFVTNSPDTSKMQTYVLVYALKDGQLVKQFGGPDVFQIQSDHSVILFLRPDKFAVNSSGKVSLYNYEFELLQEQEHGRDSFFYVPWGDKFIARHIYRENKINYYRLNLYDSELNIIKELCRKEFTGRAFSGDFSFAIYQDKLYVAKRRDDFFIEVFDKEGNLVKSIAHDCAQVKVTQAHKDEHMSKLTNRPGWENYFKSREEMEAYFRKLVKFPEYFPAIERILLADDKIYVQTRNQAEDQQEFWVLDLDGQVLERKMVPFKMRSEIICYPYTIQDERLYQLIFDAEAGEWELYASKIL